MKYNLTKEDFEWVSKVAENRQANKEKFRVRSQKFTERYSDLDTHVLGLIGEFVVAKWLDVETSPMERLMLGGDGGIDFNKLGVSIQVKTRRGHNRDLLVSTNDLKSDCYILVTVVGKSTIIHGFCTRSHLMDSSTEIVDFGYGERFIVKQRDLLSTDTFESAVEIMHDPTLVEKSVSIPHVLASLIQ